MSVCLSDRMQQLGSHETDFREIWYLSIFRKTFEKIQVSLKSNTLHEDPHNILIIFRSIRFRIRNVSDKRCTGNQNARFLFSNFFFESRAVYEIIWKNTAERGRPQMTIWRIRFTYWIIKTTDTHTNTKCNTYYFSTATMAARTRLNVTLYVHCLSCLRSMYTTSCRLRYMIQHKHRDPIHFAPRYAPQTLTHRATNEQFPLPTATTIIWLCINRISRLPWPRSSVLAFGTQVRGFAPSRSRRIFRAKKSPSEGT